ncbi:MAG: 50S ribosomal protein L19 [Anaerolineae bacterium]
MNMKQSQLIQSIEAPMLKRSIPRFRVGDTLTIHTRIIEGEKERIQMFTGTVIARRGSGLSETVSLYRVSYNAGMERVFMIHSPMISKIEVVRSGKVRRGKLYYLRGTSGKASKVKEQLSGARQVARENEEVSDSSEVEPAT